MKRQNSLGSLAVAGSLTILGSAACAYYDTDRMEGRRLVTVTGCVQAAPGINNFVLSNVGAKQGAEPQQRRTYRLEGDRALRNSSASKSKCEVS